MALALLPYDETYEEFVLKFVERFFWIAAAVDPIGDHPDEMWDEEDGFFYDVLRLPDGSGMRMKVRSLVGLLPICATTVIEADLLQRYPKITEQARTFLERNQDLLANIANPAVPGVHGRRILSLVNEDKLRRILARMLDEERFLGPHGIRSISRWHLDHPYTFNVGGAEYRVQYEPAESTTGMFGGNSNWRGPVWFPINLLLIRALLQHYRYYGNDLKVECPTGSGTMMTLFEVAQELSRRLAGTFLRDDNGRRPVYGGTRLFQDDPHWRDLILFYEYFHGDNGAGLGASHQTGWTGLVARLIQTLGQFDAATVLEDRQWPMARPYRRLAGAGHAPDDLDEARLAAGSQAQQQRSGRQVGVVGLGGDHALAPLVQDTERAGQQCAGQPASPVRATDADQAQPRSSRAVPDADQPDVVAAVRIDGNQVRCGIELIRVERLLAEVTGIPLPPRRARHVLAQCVIQPPELLLVGVSSGDDDHALGLGDGVQPGGGGIGGNQVGALPPAHGEAEPGEPV